MDEVVVDTGPWMEGFSCAAGQRCLSPPAVVDELQRHGVGEYERHNRGVVVAQADDSALARVRAVARTTGETVVLSPADVQVLALALEHGAPILSDDYAVQNVASLLGLQARSFSQRGIQRTIHWEWYCPGCHSHVGDEAGECPVCASALKRRPRRR